jgi:hypothetical protein
MKKNKDRRNFIKKNLMMLFFLPFLNLTLITDKFKKKLKKRNEFIWYLNEND